MYLWEELRGKQFDHFQVKIKFLREKRKEVEENAFVNKTEFPVFGFVNHDERSMTMPKTMKPELEKPKKTLRPNLDPPAD